MDRPNQPDAPGGILQNDGANGSPGSLLDADWMNGFITEHIHLIIASGQTPDASDLSQIRKAVEALGGGGGGLVNRVINGTFQVWQRGDFGHVFDIAPDPQYTADRWEVQSDGAGGAGVGQVSHGTDATQPGVVDGTWDYLRYEALVAANTGGPRIRTKLEALRELSDKRCTFSFVARAELAIAMNVQVTRVIGPNRVVILDESVQVLQTWGEHSVSFDMDSLAGVTFSAVDNSHLEIEFRLPNLDSNVIDIGRAQLEANASASEFEERAFEIEYLLCRRYFQSSLQHGERPASGNLSRVVVDGSASFPFRFMNVRLVPQMRTVPSFTFFDLAGTAGRLSWEGTSGIFGGANSATLSRSALPAVTMVGGGPSTETPCQFNYWADAEL
ncbi:MAG: hypothetical protein AAGG01_12230 [Planctomycetota bacterium]